MARSCSTTPGSEVTLLNGLLRAATVVEGRRQLRGGAQIADLRRRRMQLRDLLRRRAGRSARRPPSCWPMPRAALIVYGPWWPGRSAASRCWQALANLALFTGHHERLAYVGLDANSQGCRDLGVLARPPARPCSRSTTRGAAAPGRAVGRRPADAGRHDLQPDAGRGRRRHQGPVGHGRQPGQRERPGWAAEPGQAGLPGRAGPLADRDGAAGRRRAARR